MAEFTQELVTTAGTVTTTRDLSNANMLRFTDWVWVAYPQYEVDEVTLKPKTNANLADSVRDYHEAIWQGTKANVLRQERLDAAKTASDGVPDLPAV